jgi:hypothetical protein
MAQAVGHATAPTTASLELLAVTQPLVPTCLQVVALVEAVAQQALALLVVLVSATPMEDPALLALPALLLVVPQATAPTPLVVEAVEV